MSLVSFETSWLEKLFPHSFSVIAATFRVDTPFTYISMSASTSALSLRW